MTLARPPSFLISESYAFDVNIRYHTELDIYDFDNYLDWSDVTFATLPDVMPGLLFLAEPNCTCDFRDEFIGLAVFSAFVDST